jgi:hypothetical protein
MQQDKFYRLLAPLGEYRCVTDRRRLHGIWRAKDPNYQPVDKVCLFGNNYHDCDFRLRQRVKVTHHMFNTVAERAGRRVRLREERPVSFDGRGRPGRRAKSQGI